MDNYQGNFWAALTQGQRFGQQLKASQDQNALSRLAAQSYSVAAPDRPGHLSQLAAISPAEARAQAQAWNADDEADRKELISMARLIKRAPPGQQAVAYTNAVAPRLRARGMDAPAWSPETEGAIMQTVDALTQWDTMGSDLPAGYREFDLLTQNFSPEDREKAARVRAGIDARPATGGYGFDTIDIGDGRKRPARMNPRDGSQEYYDERTQQWTSLGGMGGGAQPNPGGYYAGEGPNRVNVNLEGISPDRQRQLAQVASAMQAAGYGDDAIMSLISQATDADATAAGFPASAPPPPTQTPPVAPRGVGASMTKAEEAASVRDAETAVDLRNAPAVAEAEARAAQLKKEAEARGEFNAGAPKRAERYRQAMAAAANVQSALNSAIDLIGPESTGFIGARMRNVEGSPAYNLAAQIETVKANLGFDRLQQMRESSPTGGALGAIAIQELVALQATIANLDPNQSETQIRNNLLRIQEHYRNWTSAVQQSMQQGQEGGEPQPDQRRQALLDKY